MTFSVKNNDLYQSMNNKEFITEMASNLGISNDQCQKMVYEFTDTMINALEMGNEVVIAGLGCFEIKKKKRYNKKSIEKSARKQKRRVMRKKQQDKEGS